MQLRVLVLLLLTSSAFAQWIPQASNTTASLRGLSPVSAKTAWASGTGGTFLRTTDGGATWTKGIVPGAEKLDFRDVHAVNAKTAYLLSIGPGGNSRIYKTNDAGRNWSLQYTEQNPKGFLDCMDFWDARHGIAAGDSVDGHFNLLTTGDGGAHWAAVDPAKLPPAQPSEGGFAASGTCIAVWSAGVPPAPGDRASPAVLGRNKAWQAWFVTSSTSRVIHTADSGRTWTATATPVAGGSDSAGIFSIAVVDRNTLVIVGGDYKSPSVARQNAAVSADGGKTWTLSQNLPAGFRSGVAIVPHTPGPTAVAVGTTGIDYSLDGGRSWTHMDDTNLNAVAFANEHHGWAVGPRGVILKFEGTLPGGIAPAPKK